MFKFIKVKLELCVCVCVCVRMCGVQYKNPVTDCLPRSTYLASSISRAKSIKKMLRWVIIRCFENYEKVAKHELNFITSNLSSPVNVSQ